ncbi:rhodanese-like domain-containing protein [Methylovorus menthalis]|uniref:rhodanese-like domain-containing protein n=1 Tax=Methylovorus menthalis TaxID=1002227 RepID=UPI001E5B6703|nr:rhodanese-like domain-containing protein [Methylovorus menthalis]MCB4810624.1 rhodanese-like domain-containing protein [Methylovorus menthalis]
MTTHKDIDAAELFSLLEKGNLRLIDVRNADEVARGIIAGATHIPLSIIAASVDDLTGGSETLVFYCHSGIRSGQAASFIASHGREHVYNLQGGVLAWGRAGFPFAPPQS